MTDILLISHNRIQIEKWRRTLAGKYTIEISTNITAQMPANNSRAYALTILDSDLIDQNLGKLDEMKKSHAKILITGSQWSEDKQVLALAAGASGYCEKTLDFNVLLKAIRCILNGDIWIQRHLVILVIAALADNSHGKSGIEALAANGQAKLQALSGREIDVVKMIRQGENNKRIATSLHISERTVKAHLTSIFRKVDVPDRLHLALMFKESHF